VFESLVFGRFVKPDVANIGLSVVLFSEEPESGVDEVPDTNGDEEEDTNDNQSDVDGEESEDHQGNGSSNGNYANDHLGYPSVNAPEELGETEVTDEEVEEGN
jgi:hypothetical protein